MHREKIDRLLDTYARSRPGTQREQTWLWDRLEALSVWESAALAASLIPEESAPDSGSVFQFNWAFCWSPWARPLWRAAAWVRPCFSNGGMNLRKGRNDGRYFCFK